MGTWRTLAETIGSLLAPIVSAQELVDGTPEPMTTQEMAGDSDAGGALTAALVAGALGWTVRNRTDRRA